MNKKTNDLVLALSILGTLLVCAGLLQLINNTQNNTLAIAKSLVYHVCNESRISPTLNEHECGSLQDQYHLEFLCQQNNMMPNTYCWVEKAGS